METIKEPSQTHKVTPFARTLKVNKIDLIRDQTTTLQIVSLAH